MTINQSFQKSKVHSKKINYLYLIKKILIIMYRLKIKFYFKIALSAILIILHKIKFY
jgi:hypothetical protein